MCKIGYIMQDTKLLFLLHAPPLECNSCALANLTHHWGESPALTFIFMTSRDKTSKPQNLPMTWDDQPFYFWRQLNAHFTYNLGSPAFKLIEKVRPTQSQCITKGLFFRNLCLTKRRCNPQSVNHLGIAGCQIYALKKLIQLFCMTWGAQFHWFKHGKIYPRKRVFDSFFSKKESLAEKTVFSSKTTVFLEKMQVFFEKKTCFWSNCKVSRCKFGVSLHQTYTSWGVSLHQTYIKLTLVKCKFDVNLHP